MERAGEGGGDRIWILTAKEDLNGDRALILESRIRARAPGLRKRSDLDLDPYPLGFRMRRFMAIETSERVVGDCGGFLKEWGR